MSRDRVAAVLAVLVALARPLGAGATTGDPFPNQVLQLSQSSGPPAWATVPDNPDLHLPGAFTIECWVKADPVQSRSPWPIVLTKPAGNRMNGECSYGFIADVAGHVHFRVTTTDGNFEVVWNGNLFDGKWHHLSGARGPVQVGSTINLAVDGSPVAGASITGTTLVTSDSLCIGASAFTGFFGNPLIGQVDDVRIWNVQRGSAEPYYDRGVAFNAAPGLLEVWHFDRTYPDLWGNGQVLDSGQADVMTLHRASLAPGGPTTSRASSATAVDVVGQGTGTGPRYYKGVARIAGLKDVIYRQGMGSGPFNPGGYDEVNVITLGNLGTGSRIAGTLALPPGAPIVGMAPRDSVVFCARAVFSGFDYEYWLHTLDVRDPLHPVFAGDSLKVPANVKVLVDPLAPNRLFVAGNDSFFGDNHVSVVDVTNPFAPVLLYDVDLGYESLFDQLVDFAKRGQYLYTSFSDGTLRVYRYDEFQLNGHWVRTLNKVGTTMSLGVRCAVATGATYLFAGGSDGSLRAYDLASPATPVLAGTRNDPRAIAGELVVDGTRLAVLGPNGVAVLDVHDPVYMTKVASYCADMPCADAPRASFRDGLCGLAAGIGDYTLVRFDYATVGVAEGPPSIAPRPLTPHPNPARGAVSFSAAGLAGTADLAIFDTTGRCVRAARVEASRATWDTRDDAGRPVAPGLYLARLEDDRGDVRVGRVAVVR